MQRETDIIFDLEQQIMEAWGVVEDIELLYYHFGDDPKFAGLDAKAEDEMMNLLLGVKSLYSIKFDRLFKTFEKVCREYHLRRKDIEKLTNDYEQQIAILTNERESFDEDPVLREWQQIQDSFDFVEHESQERQDKSKRRSLNDVTPSEWDRASREYWDESRIDIIGQNGNEGLHYPSDFANKHDK